MMSLSVLDLIWLLTTHQIACYLRFSKKSQSNRGVRSFRQISDSWTEKSEPLINLQANPVTPKSQFKTENTHREQNANETRYGVMTRVFACWNAVVESDVSDSVHRLIKNRQSSPETFTFELILKHLTEAVDYLTQRSQLTSIQHGFKTNVIQIPATCNPTTLHRNWREPRLLLQKRVSRPRFHWRSWTNLENVRFKVF